MQGRAAITSRGFRHLGLGKLIGSRTWGGLIGISANPPLIDGGRLTVPFFRMFTPEGEWHVENEGVAPDLNVPLDPIAVNEGLDLFALVYVAKDHKVYVLNASGTAPTGATVGRLNELGYRWDPHNWGPGSGMPINGILPVTVPGTVWGWEAVERRFGKLGFKETLEPAAQYAERGFPISERIASDWVLPKALPLKGCCTRLDPDSVQTWYPDGRAPKAGEWFRNPDLARTLRLLQEHGADEFYRGGIARAIVAKSKQLGGTMTLTGTCSSRPRSSPSPIFCITTAIRTSSRSAKATWCPRPEGQCSGGSRYGALLAQPDFERARFGNAALRPRRKRSDGENERHIFLLRSRSGNGGKAPRRACRQARLHLPSKFERIGDHAERLLRATHAGHGDRPIA
jgi:hypothetical protein